MSLRFETPGNGSNLSLIVNTWHVARFIGRPPEGLPTELLSDYSSVFLFFDNVLCDWSGLRGELKWAGRWISADMYLWLREAGIIKPIDINEYLPKDFWLDLARRGKTQQILDVMESNLMDMNDGSVPFTMDPRLTQLNHDIFMHVEKENALLYDYEGGLFIPNSSRKRRKKAYRIVDISTPETRRKLQLSRRLLQALSTALAYPRLLPPVDPDDAWRFRTNTSAEKADLTRVILGDPFIDHHAFQDRRLSGEFLINDRYVDNAGRRLTAWHNLQVLLEVRRQTRDIRVHLQELIRQIVYGVVKTEDVWDEFCAQLTEFRTFYRPRDALYDRIVTSRLFTGTAAALELFLALKNYDVDFSPFEIYQEEFQLRKEVMSQLPQLFPLVTLDQLFQRLFKEHFFHQSISPKPLERANTFASGRNRPLATG